MPSRMNSAVTRVLDGSGSYDLLDGRDQRTVRDVWETRIKAAREGLNYEAVFVAAGEGYSEADDEGVLVVHAGRG